MFRINHIAVPPGLRPALLIGLLGLMMLLSVTAWAHNYTVNVPPPNGSDDTANLQAALEAPSAAD